MKNEERQGEVDDANREAAKMSLIVLISWIGEGRMLVVDEALLIDRHDCPSLSFLPSACDSNLELSVHRDIRRPPLAWLVSERSLHREQLGPLASRHDVPVSERSLYHERPDPLASWPDAPYPSVFSDPSSPRREFGLLRRFLPWHDGGAVLLNFDVLGPPLASTEIGVVRILEIHGADSIGIHAGTKKGDPRRMESCPFILLDHIG